MSAWVVSKAHIDALVSAAMQGRDGLRWRTGEINQTETDVGTEVGRMLWNENLQSIHYRYPDTRNGRDYPADNGFTADDVDTYRFKRSKPMNAVIILKAISCYEYQSCEHPEWDKSEVFSFCENLRLKMINELPGYNAAPWGLAGDDVYDGSICLTDLIKAR